jgi:hypothetical protein
MKLTDEQRRVLQDHWRELVKRENDQQSSYIEKIILDILQVILKGETS